MEALVTSAILAAALVPLYLAQGTALTRVRASRSNVFAAATAGEIAEQLRIAPFASLPTGAPWKFRLDAAAGRTLLVPGPARLPVLLGATPLEAQVTVAVEPLSPPDLLARLVITLEWTEGEPKIARAHRHVELIENRLGVSDAP